MTQPIAKILVHDEVNMTISGLSRTHLDFLYNKYGIFAPNYFFHPKFKLGQWDGKIRYFHKTGKTYLFLIEEILPILSGFGYKLELDDRRSHSTAAPSPIDANIFSHIMHMDTGKPIILREDQVVAVNTLLEFGYGVCVAGTGAGKTLSTAALTRAYDLIGLRVIVIVPDQTLIQQTKREFINCGLDTGEYSGAEKSLQHTHVISTWQALKNNPNLIKLFKVVVVDECHGLKGPIIHKIVADNAATLPYRFGFTGTLPESASDKLAVHVAVGPTRYTILAHTLIDMGVLSRLHIDIYQLEENLQEEYDSYVKEECAIYNPPTIDEFKAQYFPDYSAENKYLQRKKERMQWIGNLIETKRDAKKGNVLCLVSSIEVGKLLQKRVPNSILVTGQHVKSAADRQKIYDMFKTHDDLVVIATVHIAGTGLSINRIFNLFLVDVGKSFIRIIQAIGRGLRMAGDKDFVNVYDICSDLKYSKTHTATRMRFYKEAQYPHKRHKVKYNE